MKKKKKKKDKETEQVTSTFEWHAPNIQERTEEKKIRYNATLLPLMQRIISGHITTILSNLKSEQGPNSDYILREFIKMSDTMLDYKVRYHGS